METYQIENDNLRLEFNRETGALIGLTAVRTGWEILNRPHLGLSFRLLLPTPEKRNNQIHGEKQILAAAEVSAERRSVRFVWDRVVAENGTAHEIEIELTVGIEDSHAVFRMNIKNGSEHTVENVYCPYLGDIHRVPSDDWLKTFVYNYHSAVEWDLWPSYENLPGYYGVDYPVQFGHNNAATPMAPFCLVRSETQGLYAGVLDASPELVAWHTELRPGYESSIDSRVPESSSISGHDVATRFAAVHVPYIQSGEERSLTPVALRAFEGDWHAGVDIYTSWRDTWISTRRRPGWASEPHSWQQIHINSPEDELRIRFSELPRIGEQCAERGVAAIQLVGWNHGGQDQGNPCHDPDPRLGTFEELQHAIARIQAMGVKVVLFAKFTWADRATQWFRDELHKLAVKDPYGDYYHYPGYRYQTATQLLDINTKRLIPMCFLSERYLQICEQEFKKMLELGADGILYDESQHHSPALLCFDKTHGHRQGAPVYANDRELIRRLRNTARDRDEFLFAGEACYDWEFEEYHLSYHRSWSKTHIPLSRYMLPHVPFMTAVNGFNDRNMVNQCLMHRYIISYEPFNFKGYLHDIPLTMEYGRRMDALRTELRDYFWDGEFRDTCGAVVRRGDQRHSTYAVFVNRTDKKRGLVVTNYEDEQIVVTVELDGPQRLEKYRLVDDPTWRPVSAGITIPRRSAAVVL
ncbi:MAG: hypothetical protein EA426_20455 [Spirochaetaceae bacterium]|nr:MAG: hypothetical protein EA426_20455 [Spirochaetaceae bacterium]